MGYSDGENSSDGESVDDILGPEDLFNDEADDEGNDSHDDVGKTPEKIATPTEDWKEKAEKKIKQPRIVRNPRVTLRVESLRGKNGLSALKKLFTNFKFKGTGHEKEDLTKILGILQQWMCYQLCPSYSFESCMLQLETLGRKKAVQTLMKKYRLGIDDWGENKSDDENDSAAEKPMEISENIPIADEFDLLLNEEIANAESERELSQDEVTRGQSAHTEQEFTLTQEQLERIERNRKLAEERKRMRMSAQCEQMEVGAHSEQKKVIEPELEKSEDMSVENIVLEDIS